MTGTITIYGDSASGNCLKIRYVAQYLAIDFDWIETGVMAGATRTEAFLRLNPAGQVPTIVLPGGRVLAQSGAILWHLAQGSALIPTDAYQQAEMLQWMFWEQYSHETAISVRRFQKNFLHKTDDEIDPALLAKGQRALTLMEGHLADKTPPYFVAGQLTLADVALVAYTRLAHEGGFDLGAFAHIRRWIAQVERDLNIPPT